MIGRMFGFAASASVLSVLWPAPAVDRAQIANEALLCEVEAEREVFEPCYIGDADGLLDGLTHARSMHPCQWSPETSAAPAAGPPSGSPSTPDEVEPEGTQSSSAAPRTAGETVGPSRENTPLLRVRGTDQPTSELLNHMLIYLSPKRALPPLLRDALVERSGELQAEGD